MHCLPRRWSAPHWTPLPREALDTLPAWDRIRPEHVKPAVDALLAEANAALEQAVGASVPAEYEALSAVLDIPASTLSFHLKELVHADLVSAERDGRNLHYRPALTQMNDLLAYLTAHCCQGQACAPTGAKRRTTC